MPASECRKLNPRGRAIGTTRIWNFNFSYADVESTTLGGYFNGFNDIKDYITYNDVSYSYGDYIMYCCS